MHKDVMSGKVKYHCPVQILNSETYHGLTPKKHYDSWGCLTHTLKTSLCKDRLENVVIRGTSHEVQTDTAVFCGYELSLFLCKLPTTYLAEAFQMHITLMLDFMSKVSKDGVPFSAKAQQDLSSEVRANN